MKVLNNCRVTTVYIAAVRRRPVFHDSARRRVPSTSRQISLRSLRQSRSTARHLRPASCSHVEKQQVLFLAMSNGSVCLSVRPSVRETHDLWQNERKLFRHSYTIWKKTAVFREKLHSAWRISATKFLCVKTVSEKVVEHSLTYHSVQK